MTTTLVMNKKERKQGWNFSAYDSISEAFDQRSKVHGSKTDLGSIAVFLALQLTPDQRKKMKKMLRLAELHSEEFGPSIFESLRKVCEKNITIDLRTAQIEGDAATPPTEDGEVEAEKTGEVEFQKETAPKKRTKSAAGSSARRSA